MTEARLDEILAPGVAPDEVPELAPLLQARPLLAAFSTLFHGSEAEVLMRLLVLREIGRETDAPRWGPDQLRQRFAMLCQRVRQLQQQRAARQRRHLAPLTKRLAGALHDAIRLIHIRCRHLSNCLTGGRVNHRERRAVARLTLTGNKLPVWLA